MTEDNKSYRQIIKSTGIFGGSQVATILIGIARNKILAVLLGVTGVGLISIYQNILDLVRSISGFGIETTGVREIASETGKREKLIETISLIDRWSLVFAATGAAICLLFSYPLSIWGFGDASRVLPVCLLSVCVFFSILAAGQTVILHGLRQIARMVKSSILWNLCALLLSVPLYYFFKAEGIIPALIVSSIANFGISRYYRSKVTTEKIPVSAAAMLSKGLSILRVGFFIVISSVITTAGYFLLRAMLSHNLGLGSVGLFQAAWSITNVYLMLILKSMGADFYPRLCAIIDENNSAKKLINEQTYIVLIVSVPLIILLLLCSRIALSLLYSAEFTEASAILHWQVPGTYFKVLSWPLGFILLAKGKGTLFFITEMLFMAAYLAFIYAFFPSYGFEAVGIAYPAAYIVYLIAVFVAGRKLSSFNWTRENAVTGLLSLALITACFFVVQYHREYLITAGIPLFALSLLYSLFKLNKVFSLKAWILSIKHNKD